MKNYFSFVVMALCLFLTNNVHSESEQNPSTVNFENADASRAQQEYNQKILQANQEYREAIERLNQENQKKVSEILMTYQNKLKLAYKKAKAEKKEQEAETIYTELARTQNELKKIKGDTETGLVLYFDFDEPPAGGTVKDKSGTGNNGLVRGASWQKEGKIGGCYEFDGRQTDQMILVKDNSTLDCTYLTLAAWIQIRQFDKVWNRIIDKNYQTGYDLCLGGFWNNQTYDGAFFFELSNINDKSSGLGSDLNVLKTGQWHHVAAAFDGQFIKIYLDGNLLKQQPRKEPLTTNDFPLAIGNETPGFVDDMEERHAFDGWIDEVRVYNRGLSEKEIQAIYNYKPDPNN
jgi:hypothetical protein